MADWESVASGIEVRHDRPYSLVRIDPTRVTAEAERAMRDRMTITRSWGEGDYTVYRVETATSDIRPASISETQAAQGMSIAPEFALPDTRMSVASGADFTQQDIDQAIFGSSLIIPREQRPQTYETAGLPVPAVSQVVTPEPIEYGTEQAYAEFAPSGDGAAGINIIYPTYARGEMSLVERGAYGVAPLTEKIQETRQFFQFAGSVLDIVPGGAQLLGLPVSGEVGAGMLSGAVTYIPSAAALPFTAPYMITRPVETLEGIAGEFAARPQFAVGEFLGAAALSAGLGKLAGPFRKPKVKISYEVTQAEAFVSEPAKAGFGIAEVTAKVGKSQATAKVGYTFKYSDIGPNIKQIDARFFSGDIKGRFVSVSGKSATALPEEMITQSYGFGLAKESGKLRVLGSGSSIQKLYDIGYTKNIMREVSGRYVETTGVTGYKVFGVGVSGKDTAPFTVTDKALGLGYGKVYSIVDAPKVTRYGPSTVVRGTKLKALPKAAVTDPAAATLEVALKQAGKQAAKRLKQPQPSALADVPLAAGAGSLDLISGQALYPTQKERREAKTWLEQFERGETGQAALAKQMEKNMGKIVGDMGVSQQAGRGRVDAFDVVFDVKARPIQEPIIISKTTPTTLQRQQQKPIPRQQQVSAPAFRAPRQPIQRSAFEFPGAPLPGPLRPFPYRPRQRSSERSIFKPPRQPKQYRPSLYAKAFGIAGRAPRTITGFGIRPTRKKGRKKKR